MSRKKAVNFYISYVCILDKKFYKLIVYFWSIYCMNIIRKIWLFCLFTAIILFNFAIANDWNLPWVTIISRSEWWADEWIRLLKAKASDSTQTSSNSTQTSSSSKTTINYSKIRNAWMAKNYPNERKYEGSNTMLWNNTLSYPEYFNHHKNKIVIHHTATDYDPNWTKEDVESYLKKIYKYHTIDRKFWDIWYNFLIDQLGNVYEWRAGWEWAVWMHASNNNVSSIWIALFWNFENDVPTEAQLSALVNLTTAIARFYNIDPYGSTHTFEINTAKEPYVTAKVNYNIMWHEDIKATACPGKNLYKFIPKLKDEVAFRLKNWIIGDVSLPESWIDELYKMQSTKAQTNENKSNTVSLNKASANSNIRNTKSNLNFVNSILSLQEVDPDIFVKAAQSVRNRYNWNIAIATTSISKIQKKYTVDDIKWLLNKDISVLLYELTTKYDSFQIKCNWNCIFNIDWMNYGWSWASLTFLSNKIIVNSDRNLFANKVTVKSSISWWTVEISNYTRKSYVWIPWNKFKGELLFEKWIYPLKNWEQKSDFIVVNNLPFSEYMKWIVETNDTETLEKNKVMAMISKNYALFYLNWDNVHPSISKDANYMAIDDPDFFQKYVGAWLEQTLTKRYQALEETNNEIIIYDWYLPILPYFSCSAWFTLSAEEKRWWNDTPYLKSVYDFGGCNDFVWHWVWLAGQWAERLAKKWMNYKDILKYYYNGIEIVDIVKS